MLSKLFSPLVVVTSSTLLSLLWQWSNILVPLMSSFFLVEFFYLSTSNISTELSSVNESDDLSWYKKSAKTKRIQARTRARYDDLEATQTRGTRGTSHVNTRVQLREHDGPTTQTQGTRGTSHANTRGQLICEHEGPTTQTRGTPGTSHANTRGQFCEHKGLTTQIRGTPGTSHANTTGQPCEHEGPAMRTRGASYANTKDMRDQPREHDRPAMRTRGASHVNTRDQPCEHDGPAMWTRVTDRAIEHEYAKITRANKVEDNTNTSSTKVLFREHKNTQCTREKHLSDLGKYKRGLTM